VHADGAAGREAARLGAGMKIGTIKAERIMRIATTTMTFTSVIGNFRSGTLMPPPLVCKEHKQVCCQIGPNLQPLTLNNCF